MIIENSYNSTTTHDTRINIDITINLPPSHVDITSESPIHKSVSLFNKRIFEENFKDLLMQYLFFS